MTYQDILHRLQAVYDTGEARALARLVLDECFGLSLTDIMCDKVNDFSREESESLEKIIVRLENNEPVQYILGYQDFHGSRFAVAPGVLIPRPETELLVDKVIAQVMADDAAEGGVGEQRLLLDIGTGSGCIAVSLALALPSAKVEAWDISADALRIAGGNARSLGADVAFRQVDVLGADLPVEGRTFHAIVSNPPYICRREAGEMQRNVLDYEPDLALFVPDEDPLLFYRAIARLGVHALADGGRLYFEINRAYGDAVCSLLRSLGYGDVQLFKDQFDNPRIVIGSISYRKEP